MAPDSHDPVEQLRELGVTVAWASDMEYRILWLPDERVVVLNAQEPRAALAREVSALIEEFRASPS